MDNQLAKRFIASLSPDPGEVEDLIAHIDRSGDEALYDLDEPIYIEPFGSRWASTSKINSFDTLNYPALFNGENHVEYEGSYGINDNMTDRFEQQGFTVLYNYLVPYTIADESHHDKGGDDPKLYLNVMLEDEKGALYFIQKTDIDNYTPLYIGSYTITEVTVPLKNKAALIREQASTSLRRAFMSERLDSFLLLFNEMDQGGIDIKKVIDENSAWLPQGLLTVISKSLDVTDSTSSLELFDEVEQIHWFMHPSDPDFIKITVHNRVGETQEYALVNGRYQKDSVQAPLHENNFIDITRPEALEIKIKEARLISGENEGIIRNTRPSKEDELEANITTSP